MDRKNNYSTFTGGGIMKTHKFNDLTNKSFNGIFSKISLGIFLAISGGYTAYIPVASAQISTNEANIVEDIQVSGNSQTAAINIKLKNKLSIIPNSSTLINPNRLVIDLPNTIAGKKSFTYNHALLKDISVTTIGNKSRLVVNLNQATKSELSLNETLLTIKLDNIEKSSPLSINNNLDNTSSQSVVQGINGIDFQRTAEGSGKIIIDLSSKDTLVDVKQMGAG